MSWNNPVGRDRTLEVLQFADLAAGDITYDLGCGTGELAGILAARGLQSHGIDLDESGVATARRQNPTVRFRAGDAARTPWPAGVRLAVCLGSSHAWGEGADALTNLCETLAVQVSAGGWALIGEGFHRPPIPPEYAALLGSPSGIERTHAENVLEIERHSLQVRHAITASVEEWDAFEWAFFRRKGNVAWRDAYLRWGREVMGFGMYLAQRV